MSYLVIARKYRPQTFDEVVGQGHVSRTLKNAIKMDRIAHAYLFSGPRGVGKTTVARILAKALNCENGPTQQPCNQCKMCTGINEGSVTDVYEIDGASNTGVDDIRELRDNVRYLPSVGKYNIYIIDEVHMLSTNAFNALLKILEEPPAHVKFIFATTEPHKIPVTVLSRVQRFDFRRLGLKEISDSLNKIAKEEGINISDGALTIISREAEGSMRDAQSLMDQVVGFAGEEVTEEDVRGVLGLTDRELLFTMADAVMKKDTPLTLSIVNDVYSQGYDINHYFRELLELMRNILVSKVAPKHKLDGLTTEEIEDIVNLGAQHGIDDLTILFNMLFEIEYQIKNASDPKTLLELTLIKMTRLSSMKSIDEILQRLSENVGPEIRKNYEKEANSNSNSFPNGTASAAANQDTKKKGYEQPDEVVPATDAIVETTRESSNDEVSGFLTYLQKNKFMLYSRLSNNLSFKIEENKAIVSFPKDSASLNHYSGKEKKEELEKELSNYFKRDIMIKLLEVAAGDSQKTSSGLSHNKKDTYRDLMDCETTKNIFDVFGGVTVEGYTPSKK